jgi:TolA-binding protein
MKRRLMATIGGAALTAMSAFAAQDAQPKAPDAAERSYLSANGLLNRGMYELAAEEYRAFLRAAPAHEKAAVARYGLAVCLVRTGDFEGAAAELASLRDLGDFQFAAEVGLLSAQCGIAMQDYALAAREAERTVRDHPASPVADDAAAILAEAHYRNGDYAAARQAADQLLRSWPQSPARPRTDLIWGLSAVAAGDDADGAARLKGLAQSQPDSEFAGQALLAAAQARHRLGEHEEASALYEALIKRPPSDLTPEALVGLGSLQRTGGDFAGAARSLDRVQAEFSRSRAAPEALMERGRVWLDAGDPRRARACFERAAESNAVGADHAEFWLARCDLREGDGASAAERLSRGMAGNPDSAIAAEMLFDRAAALISAGEDKQAGATLAQLSARFGGHSLAPDAVEMHAGVEHRLADYSASADLCSLFLGTWPDHERSLQVRFLLAENRLLDDDLAGAAQDYQAVLAGSPDEELTGRSAFRLGTVLYRLGRHDEAEPLLRQVVRGRETPPEFASALLCLGDLEFQRGRWAESERALAAYEALAPGASPDAILKLGLCAARQGRHADAVDRFEQLLSEHARSDQSTRARFELGLVLAEQGEAVGAAAAFEAVIEADPEGSLAGPAESRLGALAAAAGDHESAAAHFARAATSAARDPDAAGEATFQRGQALLASGDFQNAAEAFANLVELHPRHTRAKASLAQQAIALRRAGQTEDALRAFSQIESAPGDPLEPSLQTAVTYEEARALAESERADEAARAFRQVIDEGGSLAPYAMLDLASIESEAGREAEAGALLAQAVKSASSQGMPPALRHQASYRLGASLYKQDRPADAARSLDAVIEASDAADLLAPALRLRAQCRLATGQAVKSVADFRRLVEEFAGQPEAAGDLLGLGEALAAAQDWPESEAVLARLVREYPSDELWFRARFGLGWAKENQGRSEEAMDDYRAVADAHQGPTAARAQFQIGECLYAQKRYDEAVRELLKVDILYAYPEWSAAALYEAGRCLAHLGKQDEARAQFAAVGERFGDTDWAGLARKELARLSSAPVPAR